MSFTRIFLLVAESYLFLEDSAVGSLMTLRIVLRCWRWYADWCGSEIAAVSKWLLLARRCSWRDIALILDAIMLFAEYCARTRNVLTTVPCSLCIAQAGRYDGFYLPKDTLKRGVFLWKRLSCGVIQMQESYAGASLALAFCKLETLIWFKHLVQHGNAKAKPVLFTSLSVGFTLSLQRSINMPWRFTDFKLSSLKSAIISLRRAPSERWKMRAYSIIITKGWIGILAWVWLLSIDSYACLKKLASRQSDSPLSFTAVTVNFSGKECENLAGKVLCTWARQIRLMRSTCQIVESTSALILRKSLWLGLQIQP